MAWRAWHVVFSTSSDLGAIRVPDGMVETCAIQECPMRPQLEMVPSQLVAFRLDSRPKICVRANVHSSLPSDSKSALRLGRNGCVVVDECPSSWRGVNVRRLKDGVDAGRASNSKPGPQANAHWLLVSPCLVETKLQLRDGVSMLGRSC